MWYRKALARHRAEVSLARQRLLPKGPEVPAAIPAAIGTPPPSGAKPPPIKKQDLYALLAGGFAAAMVLGPTRALKLATRAASLASALRQPRIPDPEHAKAMAEAAARASIAPTQTVPHAPSTHTRTVHLNGTTPSQPMQHNAP